LKDKIEGEKQSAKSKLQTGEYRTGV